jgi:GntR family transcriptional regulator/MocR family aminotransferase
MPESWASSVDLHLTLEPGRGRRAALESALRAAIRDGRLVAGARIPSSRALAHDVGLARNTVAEAYAQLAAEGYLTARQGAPTRVAGRIDAAAEAAPRPRVAAPPGSAPASRAAPFPRDVEVRHDFRVGVPDAGAFPRSAWLRAVRRALADAPDSALGQFDPLGRRELRVALAAYLGRARGVIADPDRIVVCSGFTQGLALLCHALDGPVALEDPCLHTLREIVPAAGLRVLPLAVDAHGALPDVPAAAAAVLITPAHQFPLGGTLAPGRRAAFVEWARATGGLVIEDDYDGEFRYDRQPVGALQGLDPERVVYAGTASKTLAPALRLGWLVLPERLVEPVTEARRLAGGHTAVLDQLALAELISSGGLDRHVRRMRQRYRRRRDALLAALDDGARVQGVAAGLHLVLEVDDEAAVLTAAAHEELALDTLSPYWHDSGPPGLVLGYAAAPEHGYAQALAALTRTVARARAARSR